MVSDPVADMLTRVRNAQRAGHSLVTVPGAKMSLRILTLLKAEGFIENFRSVRNAKGFEDLEVELKYRDGLGCIRDLKRVSKPGRRVYSSVETLPKVDCGLGLAIISTSKGVISDRDARKQKLGGEVIALVS
jgi:small subunit ribosomal protein S8